MDAKTAVQYLKKMVFPYLSHEQKMLTGKFFYEAETMEKEQIEKLFQKHYDETGYISMTLEDAERYYNNETYGKSNS
jgi:hypothetical protein